LSAGIEWMRIFHVKDAAKGFRMQISLASNRDFDYGLDNKKKA